MATSVFRSNEAKVKDAVKLFTLSYLTSAVWMPVVVFGPGRFGPGHFGPGRFGLVIFGPG
jgi:hypothetical protein